MSSRSLEEVSLGGGGEWFVLRGVAREALTSSHKLCLAFFLVAMVACTACCVVRCSQKVFNLWQMAGKQSFVAMGTVLGEVQLGSHWEHGITWQVCRTGYKYLKQDKLRTHPNSEGVWQLGLCLWWLGGRSEALHYSSCESGVCMRGPDACVWASPAIVPAVVLRHQCRECTSSPVCVSFEETVEDDQQTAVVSKGSCLRGIRENNSFGNLRFSGQGKLSCLFGLSNKPKFSAEWAVLIRGRVEQAELDVLLLLPECDEIADLQTTLIAATNKKDSRIGAFWKLDPPREEGKKECARWQGSSVMSYNTIMIHAHSHMDIHVL